jgi:hypothetical protein
MDKILIQCDDLNVYSVVPRYPNELVITEEKMKKALADAKTKTIMDFAYPRYPQKDTGG